MGNINKKILYLFDASDQGSRMELAKLAKENGAKITIGLIDGNNKKLQEGEGIKVIPVIKTGSSTDIISSLNMLLSINRIIAKEDPDIIHSVTLKYSLITALAALPYIQTRKVFTIAGLGYLFRSDDKKSKILRTLISPLLAFAFKRPNTKLIFQNPDDMNLLESKNIVSRKQSVLIKGSGVYLNKFQPSETDSETNNDVPIVLMPTRLIHEKGIAVFIEAARILKNKGVNASFQIAGGLSDNPKAISKQEMEEMIEDGAAQWLGRIDDMPEKMKEATLVVYPSYYGEGIPRVLLEACASGKAVITTDHPGCREAVDQNINGLLVPVKDPVNTAHAIERLLTCHEIRRSMEIKSRKKAEAEFDIHDIVKQTLKVYS